MADYVERADGMNGAQPGDRRIEAGNRVAADSAPADYAADGTVYEGAARIVNSRVVKTSMTLPQSSIDSIRTLADAFGTTMAEVVRRAVAMEKFLHETTSAGGKILIKDKGNSKLRELLIR